MASVPDFMIWHCAGCGAAAEGTKKPCDCVTNVGTRTGPSGKPEQTWWDDPLEMDTDLVLRIVEEQAEDEGLWFIACTAAEAYLQQELRRLHRAIEGK